jgi:hypothetical protein
MANCIDCLHFDVCQYDEQEQAVINLKSSYRDISNDIADGCRFFKNKADFVEVKKAAEILDEAFGNDCPCNFNNIDEWLPYLCEYANTCDCSSVRCWEQLIKHYDERGADNG